MRDFGLEYIMQNIVIVTRDRLGSYQLFLQQNLSNSPIAVSNNYSDKRLASLE